MRETLRHLTRKDLAELRDLSIETFTDTFGVYNTPEDLAHYLTTAYAAPVLEAELTNPESFFYFLEADGETIGYLKLNIGQAQTEPMGNDSLEIQRIYIRKDFQGQGWGRALIEATEAIARQHGKRDIWLGVWDQNHNAMAFYQKLGFALTGESHDFFLGSDHQTDLIMQKSLE
jgi:ribosomal protein S18 acetylase RimI-like enzyme